MVKEQKYVANTVVLFHRDQEREGLEGKNKKFLRIQETNGVLVEQYTNFRKLELIIRLLG